MRIAKKARNGAPKQTMKVPLDKKLIWQIYNHFNPGVDNQHQADILSWLGLSVAQSHDKYLGLHTVVARNKTKPLRRLRREFGRGFKGRFSP